MKVYAPADFRCYRISPGDTVRLALVHAPTPDHDVTVVFELWDVGGAQPFNSHPRSTETFFFLAGEGEAYCDDEKRPVAAGDFLVLEPGTNHRIVNTGTGPMAAITTMSPDDGFADLILRGEPAELTPADLEVF
ncbi:cupin domain-containing protein [Actinopolymorpha alba]|uniref:cupin domain-containing protein n=1 Tax=Actinopolymorpha alba TaxID=533267 RepID=UPI00035D8A4D|nr:cupin domain-containing protein [Actinopolymorpha alba]